ncbi:MAG: hypothetical protein QNJ54_01620 [Prochloraceae cyanobacterium]|nr:hypothetical protein [Prochloraceae cyanobacterium]
MDSGQILRVVLKEHKISVRKIARTTGIDLHYFYKYISSNPQTRVVMSADRLQEIVRALPDPAQKDFFKSFVSD